MPYRKEQFVNGEIYHVILRAIDDVKIFKDKDDYYRGIFSVYEFNNSNSVNIWRRRRDRMVEKKFEKPGDVGSRPVLDERVKMVDILVFCFMPNHIHLLLKQLKNNGISNFMKKVGGGYGRYFNQKYQRKGYVFQNSFRSVAINNNNQLMTVVNYIHVNPVSMIEPNFKEKGIKNYSIKKNVDFIKKYKWSSFSDYIGVKKFPSITEREFILEVMGGENGVLNNIKDWLSSKKDLAKYGNLLID